MATNPCDEVQILYKGDGQEQLFTFPFPYHIQTDIRVALWNTVSQDYDDLIYQTDWVFDNAQTVKINTPPPVPPSKIHASDPDIYNVKIYRLTDIDPLDAVLNPASAIRAHDLNNNFEQLKLAIEENRCFVPPSTKKYLQYNYWNKTPADKTVRTDSAGNPVTGDTITESNQLAELWTDGELNTDDKIASAAAISRRLDAYLQDVSPSESGTIQPGKAWIDTDSLLDHYWDPNANQSKGGAWVTLANNGLTGAAATTKNYGTVRLWMGDNPPSAPDDGVLWRNTANGRIYFFNGSVWVGS